MMFSSQEPEASAKNVAGRVPYLPDLLSAIVVSRPPRNHCGVRILPNFEVVGGDLVNWKPAGLQYVKPPLLVHNSPIRVRREEIIGVEPIGRAEIGNALMSGKHFALQFPEHVLVGSHTRSISGCAMNVEA